MFYKILFLLADTLLPILPCLYFIQAHPNDKLIPAGMVAGTLLAANLLIALLFWKRIGSTRRQRQTELFMLLVTAAVPFVAHGWIMDDSLSLGLQAGLYCAAQAIWILATGIAPDFVGRIRQQRAEQRALSGKAHFESRKKVIRDQRK